MQEPSGATGVRGHRGLVKRISGYFSAALDFFEVTILSLGVFSLAALLIANVVARNFFRSIYWAEEMSSILVLFITFVGVSYAVRKARHIRMGAIFDALPPRAQKVMIMIISIYGAVIMFYMANVSWDYVMRARATQQVTPALRIPFWITLLIIVIGFFSSGLQYVRTIIKNIVEKDVWLSPEQQSEYEPEGTEGY
ncbi:MAG: TRAP transporter small permease [Spirochaetaceae bacterium]|nr:MAG: TRAP transporter small permease [Spirochaetaceae bacterium]